MKRIAATVAAVVFLAANGLVLAQEKKDAPAKGPAIQENAKKDEAKKDEAKKQEAKKAEDDKAGGPKAEAKAPKKKKKEGC